MRKAEWNWISSRQNTKTVHSCSGHFQNPLKSDAPVDTYTCQDYSVAVALHVHLSWTWCGNQSSVTEPAKPSVLTENFNTLDFHRVKPLKSVYLRRDMCYVNVNVCNQVQFQSRPSVFVHSVIIFWHDALNWPNGSVLLFLTFCYRKVIILP